MHNIDISTYDTAYYVLYLYIRMAGKGKLATIARLNTNSSYNGVVSTYIDDDFSPVTAMNFKNKNAIQSRWDFLSI